MDTENQTSLSFWNKLRLTKEFLSLLLVILGLGMFAFILTHVPLDSSCVSSIAWTDIVLFVGGSIALTAGLGLPILSAAAFVGIAGVLAKIWMCTPPGH